MGGMKILSLYRLLGPVDLKNVRRDDLLIWVIVSPLLLALLYRFGVPPLTGLLSILSLAGVVTSRTIRRRSRF